MIRNAFFVIVFAGAFNPFFTPEPFKMHRADGLEDLLSFPSAPTNAAAFTQQSSPLEDSYGRTSATGFIP